MVERPFRAAAFVVGGRAVLLIIGRALAPRATVRKCPARPARDPRESRCRTRALISDRFRSYN